MDILWLVTILIPQGYAHVLIPIRHDGMARAAAVTFGVKVVIGPETPDDLATDINFVWAQSIGQGLDAEVSSGPTVVRWNADGGEPVVGEGGIVASGGSVEASPPPNVAVLIRKTTARGGRRGRGRMYVPWWANEGNMDEMGNLTTGFVSAAQDQLDDFLVGLATNSTPMVILHNSGGKTAPGLPNEVTSATIDPLIATQRRRLGR